MSQSFVLNLIVGLLMFGMVSFLYFNVIYSNKPKVIRCYILRKEEERVQKVNGTMVSRKIIIMDDNQQLELIVRNKKLFDEIPIRSYAYIRYRGLFLINFSNESVYGDQRPEV